MKKLFVYLLTMLLGTACLAQSPYAEVKLEEKTDYQQAEAQVLKAANYLYANPFDKENLERLYAIEFIMKWMMGTPDYSFSLDEKFSKPFEGEADLLGLYMAAMTKYTLEHKNQTVPPEKLAITAIKMVVDYSNKSSNGLKQTGELKKLATAAKKGELEKYFGM